MKKVIAIILTVVAVMGLVSCEALGDDKSVDDKTLYQLCIDHLIEQNERLSEEDVTFRVDELNITGGGARRYFITVTYKELLIERKLYYDCTVESRGDKHIISVKEVGTNPKREDL